ncbi:MAG TPA: tetratricopeptide repeat protein [Longimicrobium sp.]|nr:tetratricopeptide repeat protein [Longimicrobium sp.]
MRDPSAPAVPFDCDGTRMRIVMKRTWMVAAALLLRAGAAAAQEPVNFMHALGLSARASARGDTAGALAALEAAERRWPGQPMVLRELARVHARAGRRDEAVAALGRLWSSGVAAPLEDDPALAPLRRLPAFRRVSARLAAAAAPLVRADTAFVLDDADLVPESVAYDPASRSFFAGSMGRRKVVRVGPSGAVSDFVPAGPEGPGEVLGIRVDPARGALWVNHWMADDAAPAGFAGRRGWAAMDRYDLRTGRRTWRAVLRDTARAHLLNDLAVDAAGEVFATDSEGGAVYRLRPGADTLERFFGGPPDFVYPNGIALAPDGRTLFVAHLEGISAFGRDGRRRLLAAPPEVATGFGDGLYPCGDRLVMIQGLDGHHRVAAFRLDAARERVTGAVLLEQRHPAHDVPTTGVLVDGALVYVANSQVRRVNVDGTLSPDGRARPVLLRLPLECGDQ